MILLTYAKEQGFPFYVLFYDKRCFMRTFTLNYQFMIYFQKLLKLNHLKTFCRSMENYEYEDEPLSPVDSDEGIVSKISTQFNLEDIQELRNAPPMSQNSHS